MALKLGDVGEGDVLIADGGFTCLREGQHCLVRSDEGGLWVACDDGSHMLDGQLNDADEYVGFSRA